MNITVTINLDTEEELTDLLSKLSGKTSTAKAVEKAEVIRKPIKKVIAKNVEAEPVEDTTDEVVDKLSQSEGITIEAIRELVIAKAKIDKDSVREKLSELGAKNVTLLEPQNYKEFHDFLLTI
jgi:hypothetical protein